MLTTAGEISVGDGVIFFKVTQSLVERGSLRIETTPEVEYIAGVRPGWSYFGSGFPIVSAPLYALGKAVAAFHPRQSAKPILKLFTSLTNAVLSALIVLVFFRFAARLSGSLRAAVLSTLILMLATTLWMFSKDHFREPLATLGLLTCVHWLRRNRENGRTFYALGAGVAFVLMVWTRFELWALAPILGAYALAAPSADGMLDLRRWRWRAAALFAATPACSLPLFLYFAYLKFGHPLNFGYPHDSMTATPLGVGLRGLLISPLHGLFIFAPPAALGLLALPRLAKRECGLACLIGGLFLFMLLFYGKFSVWSGGFTVGPRFLTPIVPLLLLPLALLMELEVVGAFGGATIAAVAVGGFAVQALAAAGSWTEFSLRYIQSFGREGLYHTVAAFMFSPLDDYWRQLLDGQVDIAWLRLTELGAPHWLLVIPAAAVVALVAAVVALRASLRIDAGRVGWRELSGARRLAAVALALAMVGAVGLIVVERTLAPRGLKLDAVDPDATPPRVLQRLDRQEPLLDAGRNPIDAAAEHGLAAWRGFLRVPAFFFTNHLHLTTNRPCSIEIGGKTVFEAAASDSVQRVVMTEKVDLGRGFYPILIMLTYPDRGALLHVRWSIQDFAFQELIGRDNFFARPPTGFVGLLVAAEFHLLATACATGFLLLVLLLDARRRAAS